MSNLGFDIGGKGVFGAAEQNIRRVKAGVGKPVSDAEAELSRLRAENARLKLEKEILKKAAAYFAKESM